MVDPGKVAQALGDAAKSLAAFATADPVDLPTCHTKIIHDGRGFRWNRQMAVHRLADGRLEQRLIRRDTRRLSTVEVAATAIAFVLVVLVFLYVVGLARLP